MKFQKLEDSKWHDLSGECPYVLTDKQKHKLEVALKYSIEDTPPGGLYSGDITYVNNTAAAWNGQA